MGLEWRWWKLDEATGDAIDGSDNLDDLTENGTVPAQTGKVNGARGVYSLSNYFDNSSFSGFASTQSFSISFWAYCAIDPTTVLNSFAYFGQTGNEFQSFFRYQSGTWYFIAGKYGAGTDSSSKALAASVGNWYWVSITYNGSTGAMEIDVNNSGTPGTGTYSQVAANAFTSFILGHEGGTPTSHFYLDDFRFFDFVLSSSQKSELYNSGSGSAAPLGGEGKYEFGWWRLNESTGNALDFSGNGNNIAEQGTVPAQTGKIDGARGAYSAANYFYDSTFSGFANTQSFSLSFWAYCSANPSADNHIICFGNTADHFQGFFYYNHTSSRWEFKLGKNGVALNSAFISGTASSGNWYWFCATYNTTTGAMTVNVNNSTQGTGTYAQGAATSFTGFYISAPSMPTASFYVDDLRLYKRVLTPSEQRDIYAEGNGTKDPLLLSSENLLNAYIKEFYSENLINANIKAPYSGDNNLNARINIEKEGTAWTMIDGQDFSDRYMRIRTVKKLSQLSQFECELTGIEEEDKAYIQKGKTVYFYFDNQNNLMLKGEIATVEYQTEFDCKITGYGTAKNLQGRKVNPRNVEGKSIFTRVNSDTIVSTLCSFNDDAASPFILSVGQNDSVPGITIRFDEEDKLRAVASTADSANLDWWMTHIGDAQDVINVGLRDTTSKMTFYTAGANQNAYGVSYEEDIENLANYVVAIGKGDGVNQYSTTYYDASPTWTEVSGTEISAYSSDSNTVALYHFENNGLDSGPSGHDLSTSGTPTYISSGAVIGNYSANSQPSLTYYHYAGSPNTTWFTNMPSGTFEFWAYPISGNNVGTVALISSGAQNHTMFHLTEVFSAGKRNLFAVFQKGGVLDAVNSFKEEQWNHFALTWDLGSMEARMYFNGILDSVHAGSFYIEDITPSKLRLGVWSAYIDEMRLSNSVRTSFTTDATNITETQNTVPVSGTSGFSSPGTINIGNEQIIYSGTDATKFNDCTRGANSTTAITHPIGALTFKYISSGTFWADNTLSESGSSIYSNGLKFKKIDARDSNDINAIQTNASNYLKENRTLSKRIIIEVGDMRDVYDAVEVGEWVTVVDADTGLNEDYKVVGMETNISYEDGEKMYLELVKTKKILLEDLMQSVKDVSVLNAYSQGSTSTPSIGPQEGNTEGGTTGFDNPLSMKFYIPSDAEKINKVKLSWNQSDFQGTTSGTSSTIYTQSGALQEVNIKVDGTDRTSALGGPWSGNSVSDLDVSSYITLGGYHTIDLCTSGTSVRRISANGWAQVYVPSR